MSTEALAPQLPSRLFSALKERDGKGRGNQCEKGEGNRQAHARAPFTSLPSLTPPDPAVFRPIFLAGRGKRDGRGFFRSEGSARFSHSFPSPPPRPFPEPFPEPFRALCFFDGTGRGRARGGGTRGLSSSIGHSFRFSPTPRFRDGKGEGKGKGRGFENSALSTLPCSAFYRAPGVTDPSDPPRKRRARRGGGFLILCTPVKIDRNAF